MKIMRFSSFFVAFFVAFFGIGCNGLFCKPTLVVPVIRYCEAPQPAPPDLTCPPLLTEADTVRCAMARDEARKAYAEALAAALKACRKPAP